MVPVSSCSWLQRQVDPSVVSAWLARNGCQAPEMKRLDVELIVDSFSTSTSMMMTTMIWVLVDTFHCNYCMWSRRDFPALNASQGWDRRPTRFRSRDNLT